ncbi:MAG: hypothetical protein AB8H79_05680 [Myxococcota bacterium]
MPRIATIAALGLAALTSTSAAQATEGLEWSWEGASHTYYLRGKIGLPKVVWMRAFNNAEVRVFQIRAELVTTCAPTTQLGKKAWELSCKIDDLSIQAVPLPADKGRLDPILLEWDERLTGKSLEIQFTRDGRVRNVSLDSLKRRNRRDGENIELMRQLFTRMLSPLDLRMPKKATDDGLGVWTQKNPLILGFFSSAGSLGTINLEHKITKTEGAKIVVHSEGKGTSASAGSQTAVAGQEQISDWYAMEMVSDATFDTKHGLMLTRSVAASGAPTASSMMADGTAGLRYVQLYAAEYVQPDGPRPTLPESKEIGDAFAKD